MPNLFGNLPHDVLLDSGLLSIGTTPVAVSRGGLTGTVEPEWRAVEFDGRRAPIVGLDRKVGVVVRFGGTFIQFAGAHVLIFEAEATGDTAGVIRGAQGLFAANRYISDLRLTFARGDGGYVRYIFAKALCTKYDVKGKDKAEAEISAEFEARLDMSVAADTDVMPYTIDSHYLPYYFSQDFTSAFA